jgi:hypothetical protein
MGCLWDSLSAEDVGVFGDFRCAASRLLATQTYFIGVLLRRLMAAAVWPLAMGSELRLCSLP